MSLDISYQVNDGKFLDSEEDDYTEQKADIAGHIEVNSRHRIDLHEFF